MLSGLHNDEFTNLRHFCEHYLTFEDPVIAQFSNDIQFYLSWLDFISPALATGLSFNYPHICNSRKKIYARSFFDIALARKSAADIVPNDFYLEAPEQEIVITGPNQGGKTTFARAIGQIHYLFLLGLSVPGTDAALFPVDRIFTHYERAENIETLNGKLQDELVRLEQITRNATSRSLIIINEIFASTTLEDAGKLGMEMMDMLSHIGSLSIIVTFLDKLSTCKNVVSMVSTVKDDPVSTRTFKVIRKRADGHAFAIQIAKSHGLTFEQLKERLHT